MTHNACLRNHGFFHRCEAALAEATIIETHDLVYRTGNRTKNGAGTFSFTTVSGQEVQHRYQGFSRSPGMKLPVHYDPGNPENCAMGDNLYQWRLSDFLGNAPFFLLGLYFLFLATRLGHRKV
jgi:hypothetical protein